MGIQYTKETWAYLSFEDISHVYFWIDLVIPSYAKPSSIDLWLTSKKSFSYLNWLFIYWDFRIPPASDG